MRSSLRLYCKQKRKFVYVPPPRAVEKVKDAMICRTPANKKLFMSCVGLYPVEDEFVENANADDTLAATKPNIYIIKSKSKKNTKPKRCTKRIRRSKGLKENKNRKGNDKSYTLRAKDNLSNSKPRNYYKRVLNGFVKLPYEELLKIRPPPIQVKVKQEFHDYKVVDNVTQQITMTREENQTANILQSLPLPDEKPVISLPAYGLIASVMTAKILSARENHELRHKSWSNNNEGFICSNTGYSSGSGTPLSECPWETTGTCGLEKLTEIKEL